MDRKIIEQLSNIIFKYAYNQGIEDGKQGVYIEPNALFSGALAYD